MKRGKKKTYRLFDTPCCALAYLSASNETPKKDLEQMIADLKVRAMDHYQPDVYKAGGQRAVVITTSPAEVVLAGNLMDLGFRILTCFPRRNGYPEGSVTMWFLSW
jgi:hypothetical protein